MSEYEADADDDYNDDEYAELQEFQNENDNDVAPDDSARRDDEDDEQHAQKVNGKIESLYSQIEHLAASLSQANLKNKELMEESHRLSRDNERLSEALDLANIRDAADISSNYTVGSGTSVDTGSTTDVQSELIALRKKNLRLQDQLSEALSLAPDAIHPSLRDEAIACCRATQLFPDLKERDINVEALIKILRALEKTSSGGRANRSISNNSMSSSQSSSSALFSASEYTMRKIKLLEQELRMAQASGDEIRSLRERVTRMNERIRIEKEYKLKAEQDLASSQKKIEMLGSHMDKLILHMKHEGAHRLRIAEQLRLSQKEHTELQDKYNMILSKSSAKDRLVLELREGSKVLEDQLRLMDEKYLELRTKLDYAREVGSKKIKRAEQTAKELRIKFAFAHGSTILDTIQVPQSFSGPSEQEPFPGGSWDGIISRQDSSRGNTRNGLASSGSSVGSSVTGWSRKEPDIDVILEKIKLQQGVKQDWNDEKLRKLAGK